LSSLPAYLHCLTLPTPFPVGPVNVYLAEGDPLTLIDTGPKAAVSRAALAAGLAALGHTAEAIRRIVITHHHVDHMGLAAELVARSGAEVWTHPYSAPWLADYPGQRQRHLPFFAAIWRAAGVPDPIIALMEQAGAGIAQWLDPLQVTHTFDEGSRLCLGGEAWHVFHTPGHAGGLICLWEPRSRTLLANDHLLRDISSNPVLEPPPLSNGPRPRRLVEYLHHMRRMAALQPALALPGHGNPVTDVVGLVRQRVTFHERRSRRLHEALAGEPRTLWELTQTLFPRVRSGMDHFLALSEVLGHLDLLEDAGRARAEHGSGADRWRPL
jgi:glyoxylase-like metal-dependent hydrolase (beta-lactamase superfamily II)